MESRQTAVWMDGHEAKIFHLSPGRFDESTLLAPNRHVHRHPKDQLVRTHDHPDDRHAFFHEVATALAEADHILVTGPSVAKLHFLRYLHKNEPALESKIVGLETVDHPSDRQFAAHVRAYFSGDPR